VAEQRDGPPAGALPDEPVVRDAVAAEQAELLAAVLVDALRVQDAAAPWVLALVEPVARGAMAAEQDELLAAVLADVPPVQDEAAPWVLALVEPVALDV
jgi:hypothetical protein